MGIMPEQIKLVDGTDLPPDNWYVEIDKQRIGLLKKAQHGPGYFVRVDGIKWQNAPGARYAIERDQRTDFTYAKTRKKAFEIIRTEYTKLLAKRVAPDGQIG